MRIIKYLIARSNSRKLIIILVLAFVLRFWNLSGIPPQLTPDEASLGYNAYSILETGRDEYGQSFPVIFKSFGDFKPGLYIYLTVPFVALFGLSEFAVRLPSALSGLLAVWMIYLIVRELFERRITRKLTRSNAEHLGLIAAFLLAINPWHIHFSRGAWEANISLTLTLAGIYLFFKSFSRAKYLIASGIFFSLTLLTYQGAKLSTLVVLAVLTISYWQHIKKLVKGNILTVVQTTVIGIIIISPILLSLIQGQTGRLEVFSVFSYRRPAEDLQTFLDQGEEKIGDLTYYVFHSEKLNFERGILGRWFNHFSGQFLIFTGDWQNPRHSAPNHGMLLFVDLLVLVVGFVALIRKKGKATMFIFLWLIFSPLPAALSRDQVHAVRALNMVIPLTVVSAVGLLYVLKFTNQLKRLRFAGFSLVVIAYLLSFTYFFDAYFLHLPVHNAKYWYYGYKQVVEDITPIQNNYEKIIFQQSYDQPYIYFLFYQKYDPAKYQAQADLIEGGIDVGLVEKLDNISFEFFSWPLRADYKALIVGDSIVIPDDFSNVDYKLISEIKYPNGVDTAFRMLETTQR